MRRRVMVASATAMLLAGCSLQPKYVRPAPPVPASWPVGDPYLAQSEATLPIVSYRDIFRDLRLQRIVEQALANNRNLRIAAANIRQARAQFRVARAELFPEIDATGRYSYAKGTVRSGNGAGLNASNTGTTNNGGNGATGISSNGSYFSGNVGISAFELDLFGRVRSLSDAALDRYFATEAAARATRLTLVGDIVDDWLQYGEDQSLLQVARDTAEASQRSVELTRLRVNGGVAPLSDLRQAETVLATAQSDLALQRTLVAQDANGLQLLVGAPVDPTLLPKSLADAIERITEVPPGVSSDVLLRRPDVVQAEYQLRAANAQIGAARAQLFPTISLTGLSGLASSALSSLFTGGAFTFSAGASVAYPIFRAGAGRANVDYSRGVRDAALATYEQSIQTAFREVSDALARRGTIGEQLAADQRNVAAAADTLRLANLSYQGGVQTFLNVLVAQRTLYTAQRTLVQTQLTRGTNLVTLYRVLGGDSLVEGTRTGPVPVTINGSPRPEPVPGRPAP